MTQPFHILGLTGPKGCGKDTVAALLRTHCGFHVVAFADALRREICDAFREEPILFQRRETKEHPISALSLRRCLDDAFVARMLLQHMAIGIDLSLDAPRSPRQIMQWWGTEYRRNSDPNYWADRLEDHIRTMLLSGDATRIAVTDVRFNNEVDLLRLPTFGGHIWQVTRPGCAVPDGAHISEVSGAHFGPDAVIDNSGDLRHLQEQVLGRFWAMDAGLASVEVRIAA